MIDIIGQYFGIGDVVVFGSMNKIGVISGEEKPNFICRELHLRYVYDPQTHQGDYVPKIRKAKITPLSRVLKVDLESITHWHPWFTANSSEPRQPIIDELIKTLREESYNARLSN